MDEKKITQTIKEARPKLSVISPLVAKIVLGFAVVNILLGWGLAAKVARLDTSLVISPSQFTFQLWGGAFILLGIAMLVTYALNQWKAMRATFVVGMAFKFAWAIALVVRYLSGGFDNPILLIIWLFFAYIQAVTYLHFMPLPIIQKGAENAGN